MDVEYMYQPTDLDDELFLSDVPIELIKGSLVTQFDEPLEYRKKDYVQSFFTKYEFSKNNLFEDDLLMLEIHREEFVAFVEKLFYERLSVGLTNLDDLSDEDQNELIHLTYRFFIKNIKKNFVNLIFNAIDRDRETISQQYEKRKDVTSLNFKSELDDDYDILVLANLGDIIDNIFEEIKNIDDVNTFFDLCEDDEVSLELEYVKNAYNEMELTGNFIQSYIDMIDDDFITEIQSKIRQKILKKYPKRIRKSEMVEEPDINDEETEIINNEEENEK